jgi:glycine/D-amino acid oxidase-like deaminating enzyme
MAKMKIDAQVLSAMDVRDRFPALNTCLIPPDVQTGQLHDCSDDGHYLFEEGGGYFDPVDALNDLARAIRLGGNEIQLGQTVKELLISSGRATGVKLMSGETISAGCVVNASGPWCNDILEPLGLATRWPLRPTRIQIVHINRPDSVSGKIPVCCDLVGGIYFREQNRGQQIVVGSAREEDEREVVDPKHYKNWVDDDFKAIQLHALQHRIPGLTENLSVTGYTGLYTVNQSDVHPVVGVSGIEGFYVANGFSGHGFKIGPAIGSLLAQAITGNRSDFDTDVRAEFLAFDRSPISVDAMNVIA